MPQCARCSKSVFPVEELKCLDKTWHKGCFKCSECGMTLNMKTYKGFNKMPYCEAHIPKAKATTVADTPEMKRIQENTKNQSNAVYHADFEKSKGKFTPVADDPELLRLKQNSRIISNVTYHGDLEKKSQMESRRNLTGDGGGKNGFGAARSPTYMDELSSVPAPPSANYGASRPIQPPQYQPPPPSSNSAYRNQYQDPEPDYDQHQQQNSGGRHKQDRGYAQQGMNASPYSSRGNTNVVYTSNTGAVVPDSPRKVGSIADYDPLNNFYGSGEHHQRNQGPTGRIPSSHGLRQPQTVVMKQAPPQQQQQQQHHQQQHHQQQQHQQQNYGRQQPDSGVCYRALYDYEAQDVDEVSFKDGDLIIECSGVDEGWMTGTVHRTGMRGMLPANYVGQV